MTRNPVLFDLTVDAPDHFTKLPSELLHLVFDYVFPTHEPDKAFYTSARFSERKSGRVPHPLECLAVTCKRMQAEVHSWAKHWLKAHSDITHYKDYKTKAQEKRNYLRGKGGLLAWGEKHCIFCGKSSVRSAILVNGFRCCAKCDFEQWPDKITKTAAITQYRLKPHQLLPNTHPSMIGKQPSKCFPQIRYGTYVSNCTTATMFLRADVEKLAKLVHGDFESYQTRQQGAIGKRDRGEETSSKNVKPIEPSRTHSNAGKDHQDPLVIQTMSLAGGYQQQT
ncbi:hypothetical protein M433DRAFT_3557 [Acidomyces richmondensis BFW]|nr:MAG: hypothetical protein FE78DRAFT_100808 [Acidomyces sp. 'richmondensis']KYG46630.1 hypothetical protein M433DRAFT_3557 [Acidomyces richmondensis BFW]